MMSLWDALRMNMMISYQELVRTFLKHHCLLLTSYRSAIAVYDAYVGRRVDEPSRDRRMIRPDINSLVLLPCVQNCFCGFHL
ncbi:hypothetical protein B9T51_18510 [Klebsiella pneumoniae]|nr:hypothetical protein B9T51_18510 [Klebsiella pneumoniae]